MIELIKEHPYITAFIICVICGTIYDIINKLIDAYNIKNRGYPPKVEDDED
jgi:hypothetical protein